MLNELKELIGRLQREKRERFNRRVSLGDLLSERHEIAASMGWGEGTTCYDNVLVLGDVRVGRNTWIGPNVVLDGSGGTLEIGDNCSISAGVQIYTHDTVQWAISGGEAKPETAPTKIGSRCYIGPSSIIAKGVTIGNGTIVGCLSFVNANIPDGAKVAGQPARQI